jgi:hypothetical protein
LKGREHYSQQIVTVKQTDEINKDAEFTYKELKGTDRM